jgi:hypothetical protein
MNWHYKMLCKKTLRGFVWIIQKTNILNYINFTKTFPLPQMFKTKQYGSQVTRFRPHVGPYNPKKQLISWFRLRMEEGRFRNVGSLLNTGTMKKKPCKCWWHYSNNTIVKNLYVTFKQVYSLGTMRGF